MVLLMGDTRSLMTLGRGGVGNGKKKNEVGGWHRQAMVSMVGLRKQHEIGQYLVKGGRRRRRVRGRRGKWEEEG